MKATIASFALVVMLSGQAIAQQPPPPFPGPDGPPSPPMMGQPGGLPPRMGPAMKREWWKDPELVEKLQISDDQVRRIEKIAQDYQIREIDLRAAAQKQEVALRTLVESDQPDESQILVQIDKATQARADLEKSRVQMDLAIRRVLNAEQSKRLRQLRRVPPFPGRPSGRVGDRGGPGFEPPAGPGEPGGPPPAGPPQQPPSTDPQ